MPRHTPRDARPPLPGDGRPVENYTVLAVAGVLVFCGLFALWAAWGLSAPLAAGFAAERALARLTRRRARAAAPRGARHRR